MRVKFSLRGAGLLAVGLVLTVRGRRVSARRAARGCRALAPAVLQLPSEE